MTRYGSILFLLTFGFCCHTFGQLDFSVPEEILAEMKNKSISVDGKSYAYKIVYPEEYDSTQKYAAVLCIGGGNASETVVDYCYYTMFRSTYFKDYVLIMPLTPDGQNFIGKEANYSHTVLGEIRKQENLRDTGWLAVGTSNGGVAAFGFAAHMPEMYKGIIVMPGIYSGSNIPEDWKQYKILIAIGEYDSAMWHDRTKSSIELLNEGGVDVTRYTMEKQGHIVDKEYDIDEVYRQFFE